MRIEQMKVENDGEETKDEVLLVVEGDAVSHTGGPFISCLENHLLRF